MTIKELKQKLQFATVQQKENSISVYVTTHSTGLQLFNIKEEDLPDLLNMFANEIEKMISNESLSLEDYSTSLKRDDAIHLYDLPESERTEEMKNCEAVLDLFDPEMFNANKTPVENINGMYIVIKGGVEHNLILYKHIIAVDKTYTKSNFMVFWKDHALFERQKETLLRITPSFHLMFLDGSIFLTNMKKLETVLHLDSILKRETYRDINSIKNRKLITSDNYLKKACESPGMCKKLRHALTKGKVILKNIPNSDIVSFAVKKESKLKFHINDSKDRFELKSKAEAIRFIKLLDDDYLYSELTQEDYDSKDKDPMAS